jgi:hypothetical protein
MQATVSAITITINNRKNKIKNKTKEWLEQQLWSSIVQITKKPLSKN